MKFKKIKDKKKIFVIINGDTKIVFKKQMVLSYFRVIN